jgi:hypothetical protein
VNSQLVVGFKSRDWRNTDAESVRGHRGECEVESTWSAGERRRFTHDPRGGADPAAKKKKSRSRTGASEQRTPRKISFHFDASPTRPLYRNGGVMSGAKRMVFLLCDRCAERTPRPELKQLPEGSRRKQGVLRALSLASAHGLFGFGCASGVSFERLNSARPVYRSAHSHPSAFRYLEPRFCLTYEVSKQLAVKICKELNSRN